MGFAKHRKLQQEAGNNRNIQLLRPGARPKRRERPGQAPSNGSRPCMLDDALEKRICEYLRQGVSLDDAGVMVGVSAKAITEWRHKGCEDTESRFGLFYDRTEEARTAWKTRMIKKVTDDPDWKAAWKLLCARFPREFRNYMSVNAELSGPDGGPMQIEANPFQVMLELHHSDDEKTENRFKVL